MSLLKETKATTEESLDIDPETILLTLDQVSQTIDVLSNVVRRLQNYMHHYIDKQGERVVQGELPLTGGGKTFH
jgi:hypothetical protein